MNDFDDINLFIKRYNPDGIIVDTVVLMLLLVGSYSVDFIEECDATKGKFSKEDFLLLGKILGKFKSVIVTPQIVAELSNLSMQSFGEGTKRSMYFESVISVLTSAKEIHFPLNELLPTGLDVVCRFGFTDLSILELSKKNNIPVLTDDTRFHAHAYDHIPIIKFEYIKYQPII